MTLFFHRAVRCSIVFWLAMAAAPGLYGQPPDLSDLMVQRAPDCSDISYNSLKLVPEYYHKQELDSAMLVLDYWNYHCPVSDEVYAAINLLHLAVDSIPVNDTTLFGAGHSLYGYAVPTRFMHFSPHLYRSPSGMDGRYQEFHEFVMELATAQAQRDDLPRFERLMALYYAGEPDSLLSAFRRGEFAERISQQSYMQQLEAVRSLPEFHFGVHAGAWMPTDALADMGNHFHLGMALGFQTDRLLTDVILTFKFGDAAQEYQYVDEDSTYTTDNFFGITGGVDFGYRLIRTMNHELQLIGGIAYDNFTVVPYDEDTETDAVTAGALNLNFGINYRFFVSGGTYLGLRARYNSLNYNSHGGTDFSGDAVTIGLAFGWAGNQLKSRGLSVLGVGR